MILLINYKILIINFGMSIEEIIALLNYGFLFFKYNNCSYI